MNKLTSQTLQLDELGAGRSGHGIRPLSHFLQALMLSAGLLIMGLISVIATADEPVNINLASAEALAEALQGIGPSKAVRIIEYREAYGPFEHIEELAAVRGIGLDTVEKNRDIIRLQ